MTILTFGTVIDVLQQCRKDTAQKADLTMAIINIALPDNPYKEHEKRQENPYFSRKLNFIYHCQSNLNAMFNNKKPLPHKTPTKTIIKKFDKMVNSYIKEIRHTSAILALCDMIEKDCTLDFKNGEKVPTFEKYIGKSIGEFLNESEYVFSEFLAKVCLYAIYEVDNTAGEEWVNSLMEEYSTSRKESRDHAAKDKDFNHAFKEYVARFESSKREIQVWGTSYDKEKAHGTASQAIDGNVAPKVSEENALGDETCAQNTALHTIDSSIALPSTKENTLGGESYMHYRKRTNTTVVRDIGTENQICLCCENWDGNMENALKTPIGSIGNCALKNEKTLSTNPMCKWAIPSLKRANMHRTSIFDS